MKAKYIILDKLMSGKTPIVFSEMLEHSDVARAISGIVIGAGFCFIEDNKYVCWGESVSLNVKSNLAIDSKILNKLLGAVEDYE